MGRTRRSTRSSYSYYRRAPYNLRSRSRKPNYVYDLDRNNSDTNKPSVDLVKVAGLSLLKDENAVSHHTDMYQVEELVLRRGQQFKVHLELSRALDDNELVHVMLLTGRTPYPSKGTLLSFPLLEEKSTRFGWQLRVEKDDEVTYHLTFTSSAEAIIGLYEIAIQVSTPHESKTTAPKNRNKFYLVFNPWCEADVVYMEDEAERNEYVLNETGRIWVGSRFSNYGKPWVFGQFEACALQVAKYILEISDLHDNALSNPIIVARTFSKMSNSFDDDGILQGNWSGDYSSGVEPTDWISSVDILTEYLQTKREVKYGQCWVFSALLTTLFRAVGIPARSVTNFESAHDNDGSMTIDRHWDSNDKALSDLNDSIWNFHVWNEVWFKRHDLPDGYDGWQVIDGTPQERSEGVMQCGPASIKTIRSGEVYLPYDSKFIIAEVNGDIIEWVKDNTTGLMEPVWVEPHSVGFNISTKAVGQSSRNDITDLYKYREGSEEERTVVHRLAKFSSRKDELEPFYKLSRTNSVKFDLSGTGKSTGEITILLHIQNSNSHEVTVDSTLTVAASYYNGTSDAELKSTTTKMQVAESDSTSYYVTLAADEYLNKIPTDATITVFCQARVLETGQRFFRKESFAIDRPELSVAAPSYAEKGREFSVDVSFKNELSLPLTECRLIVGGPGIRPVNPIKLHTSTINADESIKQRIALRALSVGSKEIVFQLHTRQLQNITGSAAIHVQSP